MPIVELYPAAKFKDRRLAILAQAREHIYFAGALFIAEAPAELTIFREPLLAALDRHVRVALLEDLGTLEADRGRQSPQQLKSRGADIRISGSVATAMVIVGRRRALVCTHPVRDRQCSASICSGSVLALLQQLADSTWRASWNLELLLLLEQCDHTVLLAVMKLLDAGYEDGLGARLPGVSLRTYRRHVANLLQAPSARSRCEVGAHAARLGLLS